MTESTDQHSVCNARELSAETLTEAEEAAWDKALFAWGEWRASGFQIRDLEHKGEIVMSEAFNLPTDMP